MPTINGWKVQAPDGAQLFMTEKQDNIMVLRGEEILARISPNGTSGVIVECKTPIYIDKQQGTIEVAEYPG